VCVWSYSFISAWTESSSERSRCRLGEISGRSLLQYRRFRWSVLRLSCCYDSLCSHKICLSCHDSQNPKLATGISNGTYTYKLVTGHSPPPVARPDKTHRITHIADLKAKFQDWRISGLTDVNPPDITPGSEPHVGFQNPLSCNRKRHRTLCSNSTGGYELVNWLIDWLICPVGVSSGLATNRGFWPRGVMSGWGLCPPIIQVISRVSDCVEWNLPLDT